MPGPFSELLDRLSSALRPRGRRLLEEVASIKSQLHALDPDVIHDMIASVVLEEFESVRGSRSASSLAAAIEEAVATLRIPGSAHAILELGRHAAGLVARGEAEPREAYKMLVDAYQQFKLDLEASINAVAGEVERLLGIAGPSTVATINYATTLLRVFLTGRSSVAKLLVVDLAPVYSGRRLAVTLRKEKMNSYYLPDTHVSWAASQSDAVVVYALGGSEGYVLGDMGAYSLAVAAKAHGVPVIVVAPHFNFYGADESLDLGEYKVSLRGYGGLYGVEADPVEILDYELIDYLVVGSNVYSPPSRDDILALAFSLKEKLLRFIYID